MVTFYVGAGLDHAGDEARYVCLKMYGRTFCDGLVVKQSFIASANQGTAMAVRTTFEVDTIQPLCVRVAWPFRSLMVGFEFQEVEQLKTSRVTKALMPGMAPSTTLERLDKLSPMTAEIPDSVVQYFERMFESSGEIDYEWLAKTLDLYPNLAKRRIAGCRLPLRALLDAHALPNCFRLLEQHGAEHDIFTAAACVKLSEVERLLADKPSLVHEVDAEGNTPLHRACIAGLGGEPSLSQRPELVNVLLTAGADTEAKNCYKETPLDCALLLGGGNAIETLLQHGVNLSPGFAVADEDYELLASILDDEPEAISWQSARDGTTLLHLAVHQECGAQMIEYLIDRGASALLDAKTRPSNVTALLLAFRENVYDEAEALIRAGANVNATATLKSCSISGPSCLDYAIQADRVQLAELLLDRGARPEPSRDKRLSLLSRVTSGEMADLLIIRGFDPRLPSEDRTTPLDKAVEEGRRGVVTSLLRHGAEATFFAYVVLGDVRKAAEMLDKQPSLFVTTNVYGKPPKSASESTSDGIEMPWGSFGGTALHYAVKGGSHEMVRFLLKRGADVNTATRAGWTPLHDAVYYAIYNDHREGEAIIRSLVDAGAELNAQTIGGYRPLEVAEYLETLAGCTDIAPDFIDLLRSLRSQ